MTARGLWLQTRGHGAAERCAGLSSEQPRAHEGAGALQDPPPAPHKLKAGTERLHGLELRHEPRLVAPRAMWPEGIP